MMSNPNPHDRYVAACGYLAALVDIGVARLNYRGHPEIFIEIPRVRNVDLIKDMLGGTIEYDRVYRERWVVVGNKANEVLSAIRRYTNQQTQQQIDSILNEIGVSTPLDLLSPKPRKAHLERQSKLGSKSKWGGLSSL